jgi:hypothetical protein
MLQEHRVQVALAQTVVVDTQIQLVWRVLPEVLV